MCLHACLHIRREDSDFSLLLILVTLSAIIIYAIKKLDSFVVDLLSEFE